MPILLQLRRRSRGRLRLIRSLLLLREQRVIVLLPILIRWPVHHLLRHLLVPPIPLPPLRAAINIPATNDHRVEIRAAVVIEIVFLIHLLCSLFHVHIGSDARLNKRSGNRLARLLAVLRQSFRSYLLILVIVALQERQVKIQWLRLLRRPLQGSVEEGEIRLSDAEKLLRRHFLLRRMKRIP